MLDDWNETEVKSGECVRCVFVYTSMQAHQHNTRPTHARVTERLWEPSGHPRRWQYSHSGRVHTDAARRKIDGDSGRSRAGPTVSPEEGRDCLEDPQGTSGNVHSPQCRLYTLWCPSPRSLSQVSVILVNKAYTNLTLFYWTFWKHSKKVLNFFHRVSVQRFGSLINYSLTQVLTIVTLLNLTHYIIICFNFEFYHFYLR